MFGLLAAQPVKVAELLRDAPRSLRQLSLEHADGWGVAIEMDGWRVHRSTTCAARCPRFDGIVDSVETRLIVAHVRKRTVGETSLANTHPFHRGRFVFAHNGTVCAATLAARTSVARLAEIEGGTDSERLFAFLLTQIDVAGDIERGVVAATRELCAMPVLGPASFLMSCGEQLFAFRLGRALFTLARDGATFVASEPLTDEAWREIPEGGVITIGERRHAIAA
jgi:glutamine amidotransferase